MSYKYGKAKSLCVIPGSQNNLPTHQVMCLTRDIVAGRKQQQRSIRSKKSLALRNASNMIVRAQNKLERQWRSTNKGRRFTQKIREQVFSKLKTTAYEIAYRQHPELFSYA